MEIIGQKLRTARILAGLSITELANKAGITKQSISQYENGVMPRTDIYLKLLSILKCNSDFLTTPFKDTLEIKNTFFRACSSADMLEKKEQQIKTELTSRLHRFLCNYLEMPKLNLPSLPENMSIEEKAQKLREFWNIGNRPIKNMMNCLESNGIVVSSFNCDAANGSHKIDGFTQQIKTDNNTYAYCVIVENNKESWTRKNFSIAHELGHIILHSNENFTELTKSEQNEIENEANAFASAFLLPKDEFKKDMLKVNSLRDYTVLKEKWFVSIGAMMIRAKQLGIITPDQYLRLIKSYSYHNYRKNEPLDNVIPIQRPSLFRKAFEILFDNGFTIEQFENDLSQAGLRIDLTVLEELLCLPKGFFSKYITNTETPIIKFKLNN